MLLRSPPKPILSAVGVFVVFCLILMSDSHHSAFLGKMVEESRLSNDVYNSTFGVGLQGLEMTLHSF